MDWIGGMRAAIDSGEKESKLILLYFANDKFGHIAEERIGSGRNLDAKSVANVEADATTAHSLSINMKKVKTIERIDLSFANRDSVETSLSNLGLALCKVR